MAWRFRRSVKILPGVRLNFGKKGFTSATIGGKYAKTNVSKRGTFNTYSLPGTGISYRTKLNSSNSSGQTKTYAVFQTQLCWVCRCGMTNLPENYACEACNVVNSEKLEQFEKSQLPFAFSDVSSQHRKAALIFFGGLGVLIFLIIVASSFTSKSISNVSQPTPKPESFSSTPYNWNHYNLPNTNAALPVKSKKTKKDIKKPEKSETQDLSLEVEKPLKIQPRSDDGYYHLGPRGGCYVWTSGGNKRYVDRSLCH